MCRSDGIAQTEYTIDLQPFSGAKLQSLHAFISCYPGRNFPGHRHIVRLNSAFKSREILYFGGQFCQILHLMFKLRIIAYHSNLLMFIQFPVAGCAITDTSSQIFFFSFQKAGRHHTHSQNKCLCLIDFIIGKHHVIITGSHDTGYGFLCNLQLETFHVLPESVCQLGPGDLRKSRIVYDFFSFDYFIAEIFRTKPYEIFIIIFQIDRCRQSRRSGSDNYAIVHLYSSLLSERICSVPSQIRFANP